MKNTATESAKVERTASLFDDYHVTPEELVTDIRVALEDLFNATYEEQGLTLILNFSNGQQFRCVIGEVVAAQPN